MNINLTEEQLKILNNELPVEAAIESNDEWAFGDEVKFAVPRIAHDIHSKTNQGKRKDSVSACTIYGAVNQIIRLFGLDLEPEKSDDLAMNAVDYCVEKAGYVKGEGWYTALAIKFVVNRWNEVARFVFDKEEVFWVKLDYRNDKVKEALDKGHYVGFTYNMNYGNDRFEGIINKPSYPTGIGHRTNWKHPSLVDRLNICKDCDVGVHDSYYGWLNEYWIADRSIYMNKGMRPSAYLIMPKSTLDKTTVEDIKVKMKESKASNALIGILSSTYPYLLNQQPKLAELAKDLRSSYQNSRPMETDEKKKMYQSVVDVLSFAYKFADDDFKHKYAMLAKELREKFNLL